MSTSESLYCPRCERFVGVLGADGSGPLFEGCLSDDPSHPTGCPMVKRLACYQDGARARVESEQVKPAGPGRRKPKEAERVRE